MSTKQPAEGKAKLKFLQDADEHRRIAEGQRTFCVELATRFESADPLTLDYRDRYFVAGLLRFWATTIPDKPKGKQGSAPKFDAASEAVAYAMARVAGRPHGNVVDEIADRVGVSRVAVEKGIDKHRVAAFALIRKHDPGNNQ
jgi:hypothetical protein